MNLHRTSLFLRLFWRGEVDLSLSFWVGLVFMNLVVVDKLGVSAIGLAGSRFLLCFYTAIVVLFNCYVLPSVWRSAGFLTRQRPVAWLVRIILVAAGARVIYSFYRLMLG